MITKIKIIISLVTILGLASTIGYGYVKINSLESNLEVKEVQLQESKNANDAWIISWNQQQEDMKKQRNKATIMRKEYAKLEQDNSKLKQKQEKHSYEKIMQRKPGIVSKSIINSTNRMLRADEADSQASFAQ